MIFRKLNRMEDEHVLYLPLYCVRYAFELTVMDEKLLYKITVRGYVQGVGFRWSTAREAKIMGITGFVKNMPDGSVYIEAEGPERQLKAFIEWCRKGPDHGFVESVETESFPPVNYPDFRIEH
jgi:acylphosphatase